jgi:hypothetical protein
MVVLTDIVPSAGNAHVRRRNKPDDKVIGRAAADLHMGIRGPCTVDYWSLSSDQLTKLRYFSHSPMYGYLNTLAQHPINSDNLTCDVHNVSGRPILVGELVTTVGQPMVDGIPGAIAVSAGVDERLILGTATDTIYEDDVGTVAIVARRAPWPARTNEGMPPFRRPFSPNPPRTDDPWRDQVDSAIGALRPTRRDDDRE